MEVDPAIYLCIYKYIMWCTCFGKKIATTHRRSNTHCLKGWVATTKCEQAMDRKTCTASFLTKSSSFGFTPGTECHWNANVYRPLKINMEPNTGGLENDRSFQLRDFLVAISIFWGCRGWQTTQLYIWILNKPVQRSLSNNEYFMECHVRVLLPLLTWIMGPPTKLYRLPRNRWPCVYSLWIPPISLNKTLFHRGDTY